MIVQLRRLLIDYSPLPAPDPAAGPGPEPPGRAAAVPHEVPVLLPGLLHTATAHAQ